MAPHRLGHGPPGRTRAGPLAPRPRDGSILDAYRRRTGVTPSPAAVDLYRLWWDLTEIGGYLGVLRRPHTDTTDIAESWKGLQQYLAPAERWPGLAG